MTIVAIQAFPTTGNRTAIAFMDATAETVDQLLVTLGSKEWEGQVARAARKHGLQPFAIRSAIGSMGSVVGLDGGYLRLARIDDQTIAFQPA